MLTELRGNRVVVRITNTLPPKEGQPGRHDEPSTRGHGIALANVRARLALLHDVQGEFTAGVQDGLYQVRITLPAADPTPQPTSRQRTAPRGRGDLRGSSRRGVVAPTEPTPSKPHEHPDR